jgi:hypothetical protein
MVPRGQRDGSLRPYFSIYRPKSLLFLPSNSSNALTRLSGPRYRPTTSQKIWECWESNPDLWICNQELWQLDHRGGPSYKVHNINCSESKLLRLERFMLAMHVFSSTTSIFFFQKTVSSNSVLAKIILIIIIKPVWTYGIELWGCSKPSNTNILQTFQSKTLRKLATAPWYISNVTFHDDLRIPYVTEAIRTYAKNHKNRTAQNNNQLIRDMFN